MRNLLTTTKAHNIVKFSINLSRRLLLFFAVNAFQQNLLMWREAHDLSTQRRNLL